MQPTISLPVSPLEWEVAADYVLKEVAAPEPLAPETRDERAARISSRAARGGAARTIAGLGALTPGTYINPVGRAQRQEYKVDENHIFLDLVNTVESCPIHQMNLAQSSARALEFAKKWGLLGLPSPGGDPLDDFYSVARKMRELLKAAEEDECRVPLDTVWPRLKGIRLDGKGHLSASSLAHHCYLEIIAVSQAGLKFYSCGNRKCDTFGLQREPGERGRSHRYCSVSCRKAAERERAKMGKAR